MAWNEFGIKVVVEDEGVTRREPIPIGAETDSMWEEEKIMFWFYILLITMNNKIIIITYLF